MTRTTSLAAALAALSLLAGGAHAQYVQLVDLPTLQAGGGGSLGSGLIDGTTGYALLGGAGTSRIVKIDDIGGANIVSTLVDNASLNAARGATNSTSGQLYLSGTDLILLDSGTDQILSFDTTSGAATNLLTEAQADALPGVDAPPTIFFGDVNPVTGNFFFYEGDTDSVYEITGVGVASVAIGPTTLTNVTGDASPSGLAIDSNGVFYFGQSSSPENVSFLDPAGPNSGTLITEADIQAVQGSSGDTGISATAFAIVDGDVVFSNTGNPDNFIAFEATPANALATLEVVIGEDTLLSGPASFDGAIAFTSFGGDIAWVQISNGGSLNAVAGFYVIPEPTAVALLAFAGFAAATRRR